MKNKKLIFIISAVVMIVAIASITLWLVFKDKIDNNVTESIYTAYVDINPLIKLNFKVTCDKDNNCSIPVVTDSELINEDAKKVYKDLVLKDKTLKETIELLGNTVKNNDISFKEVHIYTNYDNDNEFNVDSVDYEIVLDVKEDKELEQVIDELLEEKENTTTKDIIIPMRFPKEVLEHPFELQVLHDCQFFKLMEHPELYVSYARIKVTISGPAKILDPLPEDTSIEEFDFYIRAYMDVKDFTLGEHIVDLNITSNNPDVKIMSPTSIKVKYEVREKYDVTVCLPKHN